MAETFNIDEFVARFSEPLEGHRLVGSKELNPDKLEAEINNRLMSISMQAEFFQMQKVRPEKIRELEEKGVRKLLELYPQKREFMKNAVEESAQMKHLSPLFDTEEK